MKPIAHLVFVVLACLVGFASNALAQSLLTPSSLSVSRIEYTDSQLMSFGFTHKELTEYQKRLNSLEGKWWGHLSPMEMMMYSAKTEDERRRFAKMYLTSNNPKAQAERKSAIAMYSAAREIMAEELTESLADMGSKPTILFVNVDCKDCANEVKSLVANAKQKVDIYVTNLNRKLDITNQLVTWARGLNLPHKKVTLNDDKGIYQNSYGHTLSRLKVVEE
jgi:integrating conjugative element protein (TIGR03759 family)